MKAAAAIKLELPLPNAVIINISTRIPFQDSFLWSNRGKKTRGDWSLLYTKANCKYMLLSLQCGGLTTRTHLVKVAKGKCHEARANLGMYAQPSLCNYLLTKMPREINRSFANVCWTSIKFGGVQIQEACGRGKRWSQNPEAPGSAPSKGYHLPLSITLAQHHVELNVNCCQKDL